MAQFSCGVYISFHPSRIESEYSNFYKLIPKKITHNISETKYANKANCLQIKLCKWINNYNTTYIMFLLRVAMCKITLRFLCISHWKCARFALEMRYTVPVSSAVVGLSFHRARKQALRRMLINQTKRKNYKYEKDTYYPDGSGRCGNGQLNDPYLWPEWLHLWHR